MIQKSNLKENKLREQNYNLLIQIILPFFLVINPLSLSGLETNKPQTL